MNSLLVFDYETTGPDPVRDRPLQFACIRTDIDLNPVGAPSSFYCKPTPDHLPDPAACLVTGITPQLCEDAGLPELRFVDAVHRALSVPGTVAFGYDSIAFDDEITRFMLWRNLVDPYAREWKEGRGRWDLLPLVRAAHALQPEALTWPRGADGKPSFRLADLCAANGIAHPSAHDALGDAAATLALARLLKTRAPGLYDHCFAMHDKLCALREMDVEGRRPFLYVDTGADADDAAGVRILMPIAPHPTNRNEIIAWDLAHDPNELFDLDAEVLRLRLFTPRDERPEGFKAMPIHWIAANRSPAVFRDLAVLTPARAATLGVDLAAALSNMATMAEVLDDVDLARLLQVAFARDLPGRDADEALYEGFVGNADRRMLDTLLGMDASGLAVAEPEFVDARLNVLFLRYKARHYPQALSSRDLDKWEEYRYDKLIAGLPGSRTVSIVRAAVAQARQVPAASLSSAADVASGASVAPVDLLRDAILDDVLAYTDRLAAEIDPFDTAAPAPSPAEPPAQAEPAAAPLPAPAVQPDLFGGEDVTPATPRPRRGRG